MSVMRRPALAGGTLALALLKFSGAAGADEAALPREPFTAKASPPCAVCHTLKDAGAEGMVGPVLDELKPDAKRVLTALRNGIGAMPSYRDTLTPAEMDALARYVARASGGEN